MTGILRSLPNKIAADSFGATRLIVLKNTLAGPLPMLSVEPYLVIRQMNESDLERFREPGSFITERRIADFTARLKSGRRAFMALSAGQVSGYGWLSRQAEIDARCGIEISPDQEEGYTYDGFIFAPFRGRGIYAQLLLSSLDWLERDGCHRVYAMVFSDNTPSLNAHWQVGFRPYVQMSYSKIFTFRWRRKYDLCPPVAESK